MKASSIELSPNKLVQYLNKPASEFTKEDIIKFIKENGIKMLNFRYVGGDGRLKALTFVIRDEEHLDNLFSAGERVDGSSLFTYIEADSSDLYVLPKYRTAFVNPFEWPARRRRTGTTRATSRPGRRARRTPRPSWRPTCRALPARSPGRRGRSRPVAPRRPRGIARARSRTTRAGSPGRSGGRRSRGRRGAGARPGPGCRRRRTRARSRRVRLRPGRREAEPRDLVERRARLGEARDAAGDRSDQDAAGGVAAPCRRGPAGDQGHCGALDAGGQLDAAEERCPVKQQPTGDVVASVLMPASGLGCCWLHFNSASSLANVHKNWLVALQLPLSLFKTVKSIVRSHKQ